MDYARRAIVAGLLLWGVVTAPAMAQQVPDIAFNPRIEKPEYPADRGPKVLIDAAHLNFHTAEGGYAPFARLLRLDGYQCAGGARKRTFRAESHALAYARG